MKQSLTLGLLMFGRRRGVLRPSPGTESADDDRDHKDRPQADERQITLTDAGTGRQFDAGYRGLDQLPGELAEVVMLADLQGWTLEETATYLDAPLGTIKSRLHRARRRLADQVQQLINPAGLDAPRRQVLPC